MSKHCILEKQVIIKKEQRNTNIDLVFSGQEEVDALLVHIEYGPKVMEDEELILREVKACYQKYRPDKPYKMHEGLLNFVTFSLECEGENIGCAHRHAPKKLYTISEENPSPGFRPFKPKEGKYCMTLHVNEIMTEEIIYNIKIEAEKQNKIEIEYRPLEMHTHTYHSDGDYAPRELYEDVQQYGYDGFCITDHNTMTAYERMPRNIEHEIFVMPGMECTTFWGHLLTLDANIDWRKAKKDEIDLFLEEIKQLEGICGIAHPFEMGAPISCGSNWEFEVTRWDLISYIEMWSQNNPYSNEKNHLSRNWYHQLLSEGKKLAITAGRDWHRPDVERPPMITATYVGLKDGHLTKENVKIAIREGRTYISALLELDLSIKAGGETYQIGDTIEQQPIQVHVQTRLPGNKRIWGKNQCTPRQVRIINNGKVVVELPYSSDGLISDLRLEKGYMIIEIVEEEPILMTSAIYIR